MDQADSAGGETKVFRTSPPVRHVPGGFEDLVGRDARLVELAESVGVKAPTETEEPRAPIPEQPFPFIENKVYDTARLANFLALSIDANHHANGGPVVRLLEDAVRCVLDLDDERVVVAVSSGTAALHLACGSFEADPVAPPMRWVTSAFTFFSAGVGPLADSLVLDCDAAGRLDLDALRSLSLDAYDGVVFTNVFARQSNWEEVADFCHAHGKLLVVDNATGLLDRPAAGDLPGPAPMEIVSAHHTKPWGVGEGGFVICDESQAAAIRSLSNFGVGFDGRLRTAVNAKLSDLAAAGILDRLERMPRWQQLYRGQAERMASLVADAECGAIPFEQSGVVRSPQAHSPFLAPHGVEVGASRGPATLQSYYRPLRRHGVSTPRADALFERAFSISNAPHMGLASSDALTVQIRELVGDLRA